MRLVSLAAERIRLAAADEDYAQELSAAVESERIESDGGGQTLRGLIESTVVKEELEALTPAEWQWFASWRQALGGLLERVVLDHLMDRATTRFARYEVRALVLCDPETNAAARILDPPMDVDDSELQDLDDSQRAQVVRNSVGLTWLVDQAQGARVETLLEAQAIRIAEADAAQARVEQPVDRQAALNEDALELAADALQYRTDAAWFLLRQFSSLTPERPLLVGDLVYASENRRSISSEASARWYERGDEPPGG